MAQKPFDGAIVKLLLTGILGVLSLRINGNDQVVDELARIRQAITETSTSVAVLVEKIREHDRRLDFLETELRSDVKR